MKLMSPWRYSVTRLWRVLRQRDEPQAFEQRTERRRIGGRVFDELETVGAHRIVGVVSGHRAELRYWIGQ